MNNLFGNVTTVRFKKLRQGAVLPRYMTPGAAGMDLTSAADSHVALWASESAMVPTGWAVEIPPGYEGQIRPRSGLAATCGLTVLNSPGTIDSDYRGEVSVLLVNHGRERVIVRPGDRIAQLVIVPMTQAAIEEVEGLGDTERGEGGFGSTGAS